MGCIPIGSRVGGINDTVIDIGENSTAATGLLIPKRNPDALTAAMQKMVEMLEEEPARIESCLLYTSFETLV